MDLVLFAVLIVATYAVLWFTSRFGKDVLLGMLGFMCIISFIFATKVVNVAGYPLVPSAPLVAMIFYSGTILQEFYGTAEARKLLWINLGSMICFVGLGMLVHLLPLADAADPLGQSYDALFGFFPQALLAALCAFSTAYVLSIIISKTLARLCGTKLFPLRSFITVALSNLWDISAFVLIAYPLNAETPNMIIMTWAMRLVCIIAGVPVLWRIKMHFKQVRSTS
jgi:uncharacterized integral membrane protein (TIGR00697 family)